MSSPDQDRAAFTGQIADLPVLDLLRTIVHGKKTGTARFETHVGRGTLWFREGAFIDADFGRFHLEDAICQLLRVREGTFEVEYKPVARQCLIKESAAALLQQVQEKEADEPAPTGPRGRRIRRAPKSWSPTGGGHGSFVGPLPTAPGNAPPMVAGSAPSSGPATTVAIPQGPASAVSLRPVLPVSGMTVRMPPQGPSFEPAPPPPPPNFALEPPPSPVRPPAAEAGAPVPRTRTKSTVFGLPVRPPGESPTGSPAVPSPPDPFAAARETVQMSALAPVLARGLPSDRGDGMTPRLADEDRSGPISVGTTWKAPARLANTGTQEMRAIQSDARPTAGGVIQPGRGSSDRSISGGTRPPTGETERVNDARASQSAGARPDDGGAGQGGAEAQAGPFAAGESGSRRGAPAVVGRYEVLLRIARGGMGTVYLCRVTGEGGFRRLFALKVIREHLSRNEEYVEMLLQEARIASRLHHPNVVGIIDIGVLSGQHYLVMDYVEGCTLSELLKAHPQHRPPQLIVPIVLDALTGLHAAHTLTDDDGSPLTLVHCDFSPHNMLVGTNGICMISDFGIAKAADAMNERTGVTRGKPAYLSPEQVLGERIDHRSDIFSAGVVLWNALTGEQLFGGDTVEETMEQVLRRPIPPPSTRGLRPPRCFDEVCLKALERDPARRYQSAQDMLIELRRVAITEDLLAPSTDISRWVTQTFGLQLERRRQAAGITKPQRPSKPDLALADLGVEASDSATHALMQLDASEPHPSESSGSRTVMLDAPRSFAPARRPPPDAAAQKLRAYLIGAATAMVAGLALTAAVRPQWFTGGYVDGYGSYVDMPATFEIDMDAVLERQLEKTKVTDEAPAKPPSPPPEQPKPDAEPRMAVDPEPPPAAPAAEEPAPDAVEAHAEAVPAEADAVTQAPPEPVRETRPRRAKRREAPAPAPETTPTEEPAATAPANDDAPRERALPGIDDPDMPPEVVETAPAPS